MRSFTEELTVQGGEQAVVGSAQYMLHSIYVLTTRCMTGRSTPISPAYSR